MMNREVKFSSLGSEELTAANVREYGKVPSTAEDTMIGYMIKAVRELQEEWTERSFIGKTVTVNWRSLEGDYLVHLPYGPIRAITSIKRVYDDGTLSDALVSGTDYYIEGMDFQTVKLYTRWASAGKIITGLRAVYTAGHGTSGDQVPLPNVIRQTMLRQIITDLAMRDDLEVYQPVLYDWVKEALQPFKMGNLWL